MCSVAVKCESISTLSTSSVFYSSLISLSVMPFQDDSSVSSEDMNNAEPTWVAAEQPAVPEPSPPNGERVSNPVAAIKEEDGKTWLAAMWLRNHASC